MGLDSVRSAAEQELDHVFATDMRGKSVLDVGTGEGALCLEALRRGAARALGVDIDDTLIGRARTMAESMGLPAEFRLANIDEYCPKETFDYVLCRGALTRVRNPFLLLERLIDLTNERLILEIADPRRRGQKELKLRWWHRLILRGVRDVPLVFVNRRPGRRDRQRFFLTVSAVKCLLREHRSVFWNLDIVPSVSPGRYLLVAHKRRIDRLIVIAGPTSSGKSTLIAALANGKAPEIAARLGLHDQFDCEPLGLHDMPSDTRPKLATVLMHHDFLGRLRPYDQTSHRRALLDVIACTRDLTVLTLWTEPKRLQEQFEESEFRTYVSRRGVEPTNPKTLRLRRDYQDPQKIVDYYASWLRFVSTLPGDHLVLSQFPQPQFSSVDEWLSRHGGSRPASPASHPARNAPLR
jgi:SAM-dependent methyltransferase